MAFIKQARTFCLLLLLLPFIATAQTTQTDTTLSTPTASPTPTEPTIAPPGEIANPSTANDTPVRTDTTETPDRITSPDGNRPSVSKEENAAAANVTTSKYTGTLPPEKRQPVRVTRFENAPVIDGRIDDEAWKSAVVLKDFYQTQPGDNVAPSHRTVVMLGYDAKHLYMAFHAYDERDKIRASFARRDAVFGEDNVRVFLDTFNDQRRAYVLGFNPLGIQADGILTEGRNTDFSLDIVMESKGVLTDDGYTIEVAVPFKSLRYEAGKGKLWGIHIWRNIERLNDEIDSWMPISRDRDGLLNQAGHLTGLEDIDTERTIELIPTLTLSETGRRVRSLPPQPASPSSAQSMLEPGRLVNQPLELDPGLTAKFGITPTVTLDFALNPDFAQVEADATVVTANQRFPIFFPEKRPFFLEGIDVFQTRMNVVNTRAIVDPDYAAKLTGKRGRNTFGLLVASDNAPGNFGEDDRTQLAGCIERRRTDSNANRFCPNENILDRNALIGVLRLKHDVGRESNVGLFATSYNFVERHNQLGGFDGRFRVDPKTIFEFQVTGTTSRRFFFDPNRDSDLYRTGNGFGYSYVWDYTGRNFGYVVNGVGRTRDYRAEVGFTPRTNTNQHQAAFRFSDEPDAKRKIISRRFTNSTVMSFDWQGRSQNWQNSSQLTLTLQRQTEVGGGLDFGYERLFEEEFGARRTVQRPAQGAFFGDPERSAYYKSVFGFIDLSPSQKYGANLLFVNTNGAFDFDFGAGARFPRVSPVALALGRDAPLDPGVGNAITIEAGLSYKPIPALTSSIDYTKSRLVRDDTGRTAFDDNIFALRSTYQFTRFTFVRARVDYSTLAARVRGQFLLGWTPNPGTSLFVGYNDDLNRNGFSPFTRELEPGFRRNGRTFFIKASYLFRRSV